MCNNIVILLLYPIIMGVCVCIIVMVGHLVAGAPFSPSLYPGQLARGGGNFTQARIVIIIIAIIYAVIAMHWSLICYMLEFCVNVATFHSFLDSFLIRAG